MLITDFISGVEDYFPTALHEAYQIINIGTRSEFALRECNATRKKYRHSQSKQTTKPLRELVIFRHVYGQVIPSADYENIIFEVPNSPDQVPRILMLNQFFHAFCETTIRETQTVRARNSAMTLTLSYSERSGCYPMSCANSVVNLENTMTMTPSQLQRFLGYELVEIPAYCDDLEEAIQMVSDGFGAQLEYGELLQSMNFAINLIYVQRNAELFWHP